MGLSFSILSLNRISVWTFHQMVPLALAVPSTLLAMMGLGSFSRGNLRRQRRPMSMMMGIHMVLSFGRAVITWFTIWEEYIDSSSQAKNPQVLWMLRSLGDLHSTVSGFGGLQPRPFPASSRFEHMLQ